MDFALKVKHGIPNQLDIHTKMLKINKCKKLFNDVICVNVIVFYKYTT